MSKIYAVIRGGRENDKDKSHQYGEFVLNILRETGKKVCDIYLHPNGTFTADGLPVDIKKKLKDFDLVYIALVGEDGETGEVEEICESCGVRYVGHKSGISKIINDKHNFKKVLKQNGIKSPYSYLAEYKNSAKNEALKIFGLVGIPTFLKSNSGSGEKHVDIAHSYSEIEYITDKLFKLGKNVVAEKALRGILVKVLVYTIADVVETHISIDSDLPQSEQELFKKYEKEIQETTLLAYKLLKLEHLCEFDFILNQKGVHFIEANTHPHILSKRYKDLYDSKTGKLVKYILHKVSDIME